MRTSRSSGRLGAERQPTRNQEPRITPKYQTQPNPQPTQQPQPKPQPQPAPRPQAPVRRSHNSEELKPREYIQKKRLSSNLNDTKIVEKRQRQLQNRQKQQKKKMVLPIILGVLIFLGVAGAGGYWMYKESTKPSLENIRPKIEELYVDNQKAGLKQDTNNTKVEELLKQLKVLEVEDYEEAEQEGFINELQSIQSYMKDKEIIDKMSSAEYDLDSKDFTETVTKIRDSISGYKVSGLRLTNSSAINAVAEEQASYERLKQVLVGVASSTDIDPSEYVQDIEAKIKHNPNKEKLTQVITYIQQKQELTKEIDKLKASKKPTEAKSKERQEVQKKIMEILMPKSEE